MAPQQDGVFTGFDIRSPLLLRQLVEALEYLLDGGTLTQHSALQNLGTTPEERSTRRQTVRSIMVRIGSDPQFAFAIQGLRDAYFRDDTALVAAAAAFATYAGQGDHGAASANGDNLNVPEPNHTSPHAPAESSSIFSEISSKTPVKRGRHAPNLQKGFKCYDDKSFDRSHAKLGQPDESKFLINLPSRKENPKKPGMFEEGNGAIYLYPNRKGFGEEGKSFAPFDWSNATHVKKLHQWREQVFRRRIGGVRPTRKNWMESEKFYLLSMIKQQLKTHHRPKFNKLANAFNNRFHGTIQRRGQRAVFKGKTKNDGVLEEDRPAPWRTVSALEGQTFKWDEYHKMIEENDRRRAQAAAENDSQVAYSSADEVEIPDPTPPQTDFLPRKYRPWISLRAKQAAKKAAGTTTKKSSTPSKMISSSKSAGIKRNYKEVNDDSEDEDDDSKLSDVESDELSEPNSFSSD